MSGNKKREKKMNWIELYNLDILGIYVILGIVAYASAKDLKRQKRARREAELKKETAAGIRKYFKAKTLDATKRKSLQPANQKPIPNGWTTDDENQWREANIKPADRAVDTKRPKSNHLTEKGLEHDLEPKEYAHKFYGSRLMLDGYVIKGGMTNKLHTLELTKGDKLFIDGNPIIIHPNELTKLKLGLMKIQNPNYTED